MNQYHFACTSDWSENPPSDVPKTEEEALAQIEELYQSGVPFFTKEMMREAMKEIRRPLAKGDNVYLKDMNGAMVAYQMGHGDIQEFPNADDADRELEYLISDTVIQYNDRAGMRHSIFWGEYEPKKPFLCPLSINNNALVRDKATKEIVPFPCAKADVALSHFQKDLEAWNKTEMCANVKRILDSAAQHLEIKKLVAVSLDSVSRHRDWEMEWKQEGRSGYQHGLALTLRDWVKEKNSGVDVPCFAQDPAYLDPDKEILPQYGFQIIDDPEAWLEMDDFSVVISISSNVPSKVIIADISRPAVVICDRIDNKDYDQRGGGSM
ncbi:hypothetical protein N7540_001337 [Penicillium herquei]|nr:hypothetical protein N7540_001337 [Penicillium herquei]